MKERNPPEPLDYNELASLSLEKQSTSVLKWLTDCESFLSDSTPEEVSQHQQAFQSAFLNLLSLPGPPLAHALRNCMGRCFAQLFERGDRRVLFETVSTLTQKVNALRVDKEAKQKHATVFCLGAVLEVASDSVMQLLHEIVSTLTKVIKTSSLEIGIRATALDALRKSLVKQLQIKDDNIFKDIFKVARSGLTDKSLSIQLRAARLLEQLSLVSTIVSSHGELESIKSTLMQTMDTTSKKVRLTAAQCLGSVLLSVLDNLRTNDESNRQESKKKKTTTIAKEDEQTDGRSSPAPIKSSPVQFNLAFSDLLRHLSTPYIRSNNRYIRAGLILTYTTVLKSIGGQFVSTHYGTILEHLLNDLAAQSPVDDRYRTLETRRHIRFLLCNVLRRQLLNEPGKTIALRTIVTVLENSRKGRSEKDIGTESYPVESTVSALTELSGLLEDLGSATSSDQESLQTVLGHFIQHSNFSVQSVASWGLRSFVLATPSQIEPLLVSCKRDLQQHLEALADDTVPHKKIALGLAQALAVLVQVCPSRPLYFSTNVITEIWTLANSLLQMSGKSDLRSSQIQIQVSWTLIGALMSIGLQFVKSRLNQLLLLWQNALPRPFARDIMAGRSHTELQYLLLVKERALAALHLFLQYNDKLLTHDISKRIATMLSDTSVFVARLPQTTATDDARVLALQSQVTEIGIRVKMRLIRCYCCLVQHDNRNIAGPELLMTAISVFTEVDPQILRSITTKPVMAGSFDSLKSISDNYAWGVSSYMKPLSIPDSQGTKTEDGHGHSGHWSVWSSESDLLERMLEQPIIGALENDTSSLYTHDGKNIDMPSPVPPSTALVDAAIDLFSLMVLDQPMKIQESAFTHIAARLGDPSLDRNAGRKAAITINVVIALSKALSKLTHRSFRDVNHSERVISSILEILHGCLVDQSASVRFVAADTIGRLNGSIQDSLVAKEIKYLTDLVVSNRDPNSRAGCALTLGSILLYVGGMAAGLHLRTVLGLLLSLATDPHPTVHFWALEAMEKTITSSGLGFSSHVTSCLGAISRLILSDLYDPDDVPPAMSNIALELPTLASLVRCVDAIVNVLGPDLASTKKSRNLISMLIREMEKNSDAMVANEAIRCTQHLSLFAPEAVDVKLFVRQLETNIESGVPEIRQIACEAIYGLIRKDVQAVFSNARPSFSDELWALLNNHTQKSDAEEIIGSWVDQTALTEVKKWIGICLRFLTHAGQQDTLPKIDSKGEAGGDPSEFIDEAAAFSAQDTNRSVSDGSSVPYLRWQAISFALTCLRRVVEMNFRQLNVESDCSAHPLVVNVGDLVRVAFTACTSTVVDIRLGGLKLFHDLIKGLASVSDPDFPESTLLEQYQAQIGSALTPAFAADSSPEIAAEAISICAEFISSNIVRDVEHMGRILKILVGGLENVADEKSPPLLGDLKIPSVNARLMLKLAILSAWAKLQIQSTQSDYLVEIVNPHIETLIPLWLETLKAFAKLHFEPDDADGMMIDEMIADSLSSYASPEFLLQLYNHCWLQIIHALATLIELESEVIFEALDDHHSGEEKSLANGRSANYRNDPVAFFFIVYGLCFQTLLRMMNRDDSEAKHTVSIVLDALKKFIRPSISGNAIYKGFVFAETTDLLDRLVLMESSDIQGMVIQIATNVAKYHPSGALIQNSERWTDDGNFPAEGDDTDGIEQLLDLVHILILALHKNAVWLSDKGNKGQSANNSDLAAQALSCLIETTELFPFVFKVDLYGGIFSVFEKVLTVTDSFGDVAREMLAPYQIFCRNLQKCICEFPSARTKVIDSVGALVSRMIDRMQAQSSQKEDYESGAFLATVSFTTVSQLSEMNLPLFEDFCMALTAGLGSPKTSGCALRCFRAIFTSEPKIETKVARVAIAGLLASFVRKLQESSPDLVSIRDLTTVIVDAVKHRPQTESSSVMTVILPILSSQSRLVSHIEDWQTAIVSVVLGLATSNPRAFKGVLEIMDVEGRESLESTLRTALEEKRDTKSEELTKPSISLKLDFGSVD